MIETTITTVIRTAIAAAAIDSRVPGAGGLPPAPGTPIQCIDRTPNDLGLRRLNGYGLSGIRFGLGADFDKPKSGGSGGMTWLGYQNVR